MSTFLTVLKNNYLRTVPRIASLITLTIVTLASILLAVHMTGVQQVRGHIVLVSSGVAPEWSQGSEYLDIQVLSEKPPLSDLVKQKYDAYVTVDGTGDFQVETLHGEDFKNQLLQFLENPGAQPEKSPTDRGMGVNIIGFMMMFLLMISLSNSFVFADDKEQGQLRRIVASPASFTGYLAAHGVYCLSILTPEYLLIVLLKILGWEIGFTLLQYAGLMLLLGCLGIMFALLLNTLIHKPDNASMLGSALSVLTSVLAGSFYTFSRKNIVLDSIIKLLPQKELMNFAQYMQNGSAGQHLGSVLYVLGFSLALFIISCVALRKMYIKKV